MEEKIAIKCLIFSSTQEVIEKLNLGIIKTESPGEKVVWAQEVINELSTLARCEKYDGKTRACKSCQAILNLQMKAAEMVTRVAQIKDR